MNRAVVVNSTWEALAECDLLARCLNEKSVGLLRYHLNVIKGEITRNSSPTGTGVRVAATITAGKHSGTGAVVAARPLTGSPVGGPDE